MISRGAVTSRPPARAGAVLEAVSFPVEYKERVFAGFLREYRAGRTTNPDVPCNAWIRFKAFFDHAVALGAARSATGHFARLRERDGLFELLRGADSAKDRSEFPHRLTQPR